MAGPDNDMYIKPKVGPDLDRKFLRKLLPFMIVSFATPTMFAIMEQDLIIPDSPMDLSIKAFIRETGLVNEDFFR